MIGQQGGDFAALGLDGQVQVIVALHAHLDGGVVGAQEPLDRLVRRAGAGPALFLAAVGLTGRQPVDHQSEAARGDVAPGGLEAEPFRLQRIDRETAQIGRRAGLHARRDLFGEQFQEEFGHGQAFPLSQASQHPLASARTRPI